MRQCCNCHGAGTGTSEAGNFNPAGTAVTPTSGFWRPAVAMSVSEQSVLARIERPTGEFEVFEEMIVGDSAYGAGQIIAIVSLSESRRPGDGMTAETLTRAEVDPPAKQRRKLSYRPDIQGLRAIAVSAVVLYHAGVPWLQGGYVGVDIFFVISGFLIIGLLWREIEGTGRIHLRSFYARRIRRLLPASTLVALVILLASRLFMPPLAFPDIARDGIATSVFLVNMLFARVGTQYSGNPSPSPFQHYWSLNVEEQFYLFLPLLLIACWWVFKKNRRTGFILTLLVLSVVSIAASVVLTPTHFSWAFFSLPTRAWEMALGGVLALSLPFFAKVPAAVKTALSAGGFVVVIASIVLFSEETVFPGFIAAVPVLGTLAIIAGGVGDSNRVNRAIGGPVFTYIGDISYSLYLWHWPLLVIPVVALGGNVGPVTTALLVAIAFGLAALTYRFVEQPFKDLRWLKASFTRTYAVGAVLVVATLVASIGVGQLPRMDSGTPTTPFSMSDSGTVPAEASFVPANATPTLTGAITDLPVTYDNGCQADTTVVDPADCVFGDVGSDSKVVLFGDSHAAQWFPAVEAAATAQSMELVNITKSACPAADLHVRTATQKDFPECQAWRDTSIAEINSIAPDVILIASYGAGYEDRIEYDGAYADVWESALAATLAQLPKSSKVVVLGETPVWEQNPNECLSAHVSDAGECSLALDGLTRADLIAAEESAAGKSDAEYAPTTPWLCAGECSPLAWDKVVYRDLHHITNAMSLTLQKPMEALLR
jgi:peptidoglycan/LPS O-acetylase OafA/YrhL